VTLRQLRMGRAAPTLKDALVTDFRLATRMVPGHDFREGVRAVLIDKDRSPKWQPATLAEVSEDTVAAAFAPLGENELRLTDHWKLID
jgi:enoyl-CoA hydratase